jgi:hypothetical protein
MKRLKLIIWISFFLGTSTSVAAQADCLYQILIDVRDEANNPVNNAKLKLSGWKAFAYRTPPNLYETSGLLGVGGPAWKARLKVSAGGYKTFDQELLVSCARYEYLLILRPKRSKLAAELKAIPIATK